MPVLKKNFDFHNIVITIKFHKNQNEEKHEEDMKRECIS